MTQEDLGLPVTSSTEPAWALEAQECYRDAVQALQEAGVRYAAGGAFAIHKHTGIWRATKDLDLLLVASDVPRALRQLEQRGFETYIEDPVWLAKARRGKYFVDLITGMGNASLIVDESWIDRSVEAEILGIACKVLAPEEMIAAKVFIGFRERFDGSDIMHLIRAVGRQLDWDRLLQLLGEHWLLLYWALVLFAYVYPARTDAVPKRIWSGLAQRLGEQVELPKKDAPFRGTLIDPKMFAIDVNEWGERDLLREYCDQHPSLLRTEDAAGSAE
jgi:Uncharacterised nucleotidyltransferase